MGRAQPNLKEAQTRFSFLDRWNTYALLFNNLNLNLRWEAVGGKSQGCWRTIYRDRGLSSFCSVPPLFIKSDPQLGFIWSDPLQVSLQLRRGKGKEADGKYKKGTSEEVERFRKQERLPFLSTMHVESCRLERCILHSFAQRLAWLVKFLTKCFFFGHSKIWDYFVVFIQLIIFAFSKVSLISPLTPTKTFPLV